ncbi:MAG TPA: flagellar M-ring protein FliF, partial [Allosphingosinicella sp.]
MPATTRPVTLAPTVRGGGVNALMGQARAFAAQPAVAKSLPAIGLIALLGLAARIWMAFSAPPSRSLFSGLADQDKAAVADALDTAGIPYKLDRSTGALSVSDDDYYQAKMLLASQGLPKSAPDGNEMINNLPLGASRAVEGERLRGARELDLARTIEAIDAVQSARVHLAVEAPSVFLRDRSKRSASVMLNLAPGRTLSDAQVQAIVHLVA